MSREEREENQKGKETHPSPPSRSSRETMPLPEFDFSQANRAGPDK